jgi:hypothetical protein
MSQYYNEVFLLHSLLRPDQLRFGTNGESRDPVGLLATTVLLIGETVTVTIKTQNVNPKAQYGGHLQVVDKIDII